MSRTIEEALSELTEQERQTYDMGYRFVLDMKQYGRECLERNDAACVVDKELSE